MNVCYVHDFCLYRDENHNIYTAVGLPEKYFDRFFNIGCTKVTLMTRNRKSNKTAIKSLGFEEIKSHRIDIPIPIKGYISLLSPRSIFNVIKTIKNSDVLVINFPSLIGLFICFINLIINKKYILEIAADDNQFLSKRGGRLITLLFKSCFLFFVRRSSGAIYVSKFLLHKYPHPAGIVSSNVYIDEVIYRQNPIYDINNKKNINILFAGGVNKRKGIDTLLKAIEILVGQNKNNIMLDIAGGHFDRDYKTIAAEMGLANNVTFHGLLDKVDLMKLYQTADVYIQPSFAEGIPRAAIEAMSFGLPVVATTLPGFLEILPNECLVPVGSHVGIATVTQKIITSKCFRNKVSFTNSKRAEDFLLPILNNKRNEFYQKVLGTYNERI
jgi:glycosyltransferase involved in cell wall biosynthesis